MESQTKYPVLPSNYVTIADLKERWLTRQQEMHRETEQRKIKDKHVEVQEEVPKVRPEAQEADLKHPKRSYQTRNSRSNSKPTFRRPISRHRNHTSGTFEAHRHSTVKVDMSTKVNEKVKLIDPKPEEVVVGAVVAVGEERIESRDQGELDAPVVEAAAAVEGGISESQHKKTHEIKKKKKTKKKKKEEKEKSGDEIQNSRAKGDPSLEIETVKSAPNKEMPAIFSMVGEVRYRQVEASKVVYSGHGKITDRTADIGRRLSGVSLRGARDRRRSGEWPTGMREGGQRNRSYGGLQRREKETEGKVVWVKKEEYSRAAVA